MKTLSDFCNMEVVRKGDIAELVFPIETGSFPITIVRLIGFKTSADKTDFEVAEEGYQYYRRLLEEVNKNK